MVVDKSRRIGIVRPPSHEGEKPAVRTKERFPEIDPAAVRALFETKPPKLSSYPLGIPEWTPKAQAKLQRFVVGALERNPLFRDRPHARAATAESVCHAIMNSKNLTAKFYSYVTRRS